jgi:hypothetical protein
MTRIGSATSLVLTAACVFLGMLIFAALGDLLRDYAIFRLGGETFYWNFRNVSAVAKLVSYVIIFLAYLISLVRTHRKG